MSEESLSEWKHLGNNELELKINILRIKHPKFKFDDILHSHCIKDSFEVLI